MNMKIVIVDDDQLVALSLKTILTEGKEVEVLGIGNDGAQGVELYSKYKPDVLLMDIRMQGMTGLTAAEIILKQYPTARILFLTTFSDSEYIVKALRIGVKGYILKQNYESIVPALKAVYSGQSVFGGEIVEKLPTLMETKPNYNYGMAHISEKELEIIELVAQGLNNKEISEKIFFSEGTVRNYISNILEKLELRDRTQLAIFYYQNK